MKTFLVLLCAMALVFAVGETATAVIIGGIEFPDGAVSFADAVYSYSPGPDVGPNYNDPNEALGTPDYSNPTGSASLGDGGVLTLQFTDNSLTTSGDSTADLHIFEIGGATEWFNVAISKNAADWINLGNVLGQPTSIDIDPISGIVAGALYSYVRLTDVEPNQTGFPYGEADIDAVGAISSGAAAAVPEPATLLLFGTGLVGLAGVGRKKLFKK